ncbi:MAG: amidase [Firmicutes bacterium]|nr:amidase [Bacillota bacterium]
MIKDPSSFSIADIAEGLKKGSFTSVELVLSFLREIAERDSAGPCINSVLEINPDALDIAESLDREYAQKGPRGPLHGVPVLIKGNIDTGDKLHTSAGSLVMADNFALEDAALVKELRASGAVILGKANLTEWANFLAHGMRGGYSSLGGQVNNPAGECLEIGGSSSGSAAAVAAGFCTAAVGTETNGSILHPATKAGVVGIKPTKGLVSRSGIVPICSSFDTAGPLARSARDAAMLLWCMIGYDEDDPATHYRGDHELPDERFFEGASLKGRRIGLVRRPYIDMPDEAFEHYDAVFDAAEKAGAVLVPVELAPADPRSATLVEMYEIKRCMAAYLAKGHTTSLRSLKDILDANEADPERCLKYGQERLRESDEIGSGRLNEPEYIEALGAIYESRGRIDALLKENQLDCILMAHYTNISPVSGYPAVAVPAGKGRDSGLPYGVSLLGTAGSDFELCRIADALEKALVRS